ncbi:MAG: extracellular solute-binding protein [Treponema sp.]|jgi:multiple sugar transport system substrate-binding protein|nr:extracellular solute-binding protein [Treponema sp.]
MNAETVKIMIQKAGAALSKAAAKLPGALKKRFRFRLPGKLGALFSKARTISIDKVLWIWALVMVGGLLLFKIISGNIPGMGTTLVFAQWWDDQMENPVLETLAREFESQNPGVTVKLEHMNWPEIRELLDTEKPDENTVPDIFSVDPIREPESRSYLMPFETGNGTDAASNMGAPVISFINLLFYNIDLLQEAGFDRPPKNQTEFLSYAQRISQTGSGIYGAGLALENGDPHNVRRYLLSWIWAAAGNHETMEDFNFNSRQVIAVLIFLNQLKQNIYPNPFSLTRGELLKAFSEGKVGMIIGSIADAGEFKAAMRGNFGITTIPGPESYTRKPVFPLTGWYVGINRKTEYPEEARKFAAFLKDRAGTIAAEAYAVPGNGRRNPDLSRADPVYAKAFDMYEAGEMVQERVFGSMLNMNGVVRGEVEKMLSGLISPEQCAEAMQQSWETIRNSGS